MIFDYTAAKLYPLLVLLLFFGRVRGEEGGGTLNKEVVQKHYFEGNFEQALALLEGFRKSCPRPGDGDKAFMYKYLGVIFSSMPESLDKGKSYLYQLIKMDREVRLLDMYVSEKIDKVFAGVKAEFMERQAYMDKQKADSAAAEAAEAPGIKTQENTAPGRDDENEWIWWTVGGAAVVGAVAVFLWMSAGDEKAREVSLGGVGEI